jgi:hypothetical protein
MNRPLSFVPEAFKTGSVDFETTAHVAPRSKNLSVSVFALSRVIPDDPDYRKHVPLNYRLNAKKIVGKVAEDLKSGFWTELAHKGTEVVHLGIILPVEIFAEASILAGVLGIASPLLAAIAVFAGLGAPYLAAAENIAEYVPANPQFPRGRGIAIANYRVGLLAGYVQGRSLSKNQRQIFWRDLGRRMGDQTYRGPAARWTQRDWINWYTDSAAVFRRDHL